MDKKNLFPLLISGWVVVSTINAQTTIPGGNVSGTWTAAGSPYLIQDNITVQAEDTLTIDPGVVVEFQGSYRLIINGILEAVGTATDSIFFTALNQWTGIHFSNAPDSSHIIYCSIIKVSSGMFGGALDCDNSNPVISHSRVSGGSVGTHGAIRTQNSSSPRISDCAISNPNGNGIDWRSTVTGTISRVTISNCMNRGVHVQSLGDLTLTDCIITNNTESTLAGGGVRAVLYGSQTLSLIGCTISDNSALGNDGGGIYCENGTLNLTHCTINGNFAWGASGYPYIGGGGIALWNASASISYCTIFDNSAAPDGGGIAIENSSNLNVDHCTIESNETFPGKFGSGIYVGSGCTASVTNSIISNNHPDYGINNSGTLTVGYTNFHNNPDLVGGSIPNGFGVIDTVNANGDSCDVYANIFLDPLFANPVNGNYNLTWANWPTPDSTKSPCIDAGDPGSPPDPDGTITDMGRYFFDQRAPQIDLSCSILDFGSVFIGQQADTIIKLFNNGTDTLLIYDVFNNQSVYTTNFNPVDSIILPGDSMSIVVTFTPLNTTLVTDTLHIYNNDHNCSVNLTGVGQPSTGISDLPDKLTQGVMLGPAYPNPFFSATSFQLNLNRQSFVILKVYNMLGAVVSTLVSGEMAAGTYDYNWHADDLPEGIYLLRLRVGNFIETRKIIKL